jgi:LL-H family phage holin
MSISDIIILLLPLIIMFDLCMLKKIEQHLPEKKREDLKDFVSTAVKSIEQQYSDQSGQYKKDLAMKLVSDLFAAYKLPLPDSTLVYAAIEAAIWEMKNSAAYTGIKQRRDPAPQNFGARFNKRYISPDSTNDLRG